MLGHSWAIDLNLTRILISSALRDIERRERGKEEGGQIFRARETAITLLFDAFKASARIGAL